MPEAMTAEEIERLRAENQDLRKALRMVGVVVSEALAAERDEDPAQAGRADQRGERR